MKEARKKKIEDMRNRKIEDDEKIPPIPKLKRSKAVDMKQEIIKSSSSSSSSTSTDSSNYESDEKTDKVIIHNYDENEPESKLIIKKVRRKNKINHEELKKIYDEVNKEEKKTRKRKIDNSDIPKRRRAPPKPKPKQQQQQKQDDIPIIYYI